MRDLDARHALDELIAAMLARGGEDGEDIVANLAPPCSEAHFDAITRDVVPVPDALRALHLAHDGQRIEGAGFFEGGLDFLSIAQARARRDRMLDSYVGGPSGLLRRDEPGAMDASDLYDEEVSERWWPIASLGRDYLVLHLDTGRVVLFWRDSRPVKPLASNLSRFFRRTRDRLERGAIHLTEVGVESASYALRMRARAAEPAAFQPALDLLAALRRDALIEIREYPAIEDLIDRIQIALDGAVPMQSRVATVSRILETAPQIEEVFATDDEIARVVAEM